MLPIEPLPKSYQPCQECGGKTETAVPFDYGCRLTEFALLGNLAMKAGAGNKVEWDGPNMKVKNMPELNAIVARKNREGWTA